MTKRAPRPRPAPPARTFTPVASRARHDGWTPERQSGFVDALAASGCVAEACAAVGMSRQSAYLLRNRPDAQGFRLAWDAALDMAIRRLSDECYSRALNGVAVPHFYKGEQVGEHRRYDNRLAMFLLRYRDPLRYAATLDQMVYDGHPESAALGLARARDRMMEEAHGVAEASAAPVAPPFTLETRPEAVVRQRAEAAEAKHRYYERQGEERRQAERLREAAARAARQAAPASGSPPGGPASGGAVSGGGVASSSSTSARVPPPPPPVRTPPQPSCRVIGSG